VAPEPVALSRAFLAGALPETHPGRARYRLLAGQGGADRPDPGIIVCACFQVGVNQIAEVIRSGAAATVESVGQALKAGTNCGSCRSEIGKMLESARAAPAAWEARGAT
jgi:assimilatory nitrate reductase catalytic subunit